MTHKHTCQNICSRFFYLLYTNAWPGRAEINRSLKQSISDRSFYYKLDSSSQINHQFDSLRAQIQYCRHKVPYYEKLLRNFPSDFPKTFSDFREIPPLEKSSIRLDPDAFISREFRRENLSKHSTGGSTGQPVSVYLSPTDQGIAEGGNQFFMQMINGQSGKRIGTLYGGELDLSSHSSDFEKIKNWLLNFSPHGCFRLDEEYLLLVHDDLEKFQPDIFLGYASAIYLLAVVLKNHNIEPHYPSNIILSAAEKLDNRQRKTVEEVFKKPVIERYGSRDLGLIAYQVTGKREFQVDHWDYLIEPDGNINDNREAQILITRLHTKGMPLIRYRIGDIAKFPETWRPDRPAHYLEEIIGRTLGLIHLPGGRLVHGSEFPHLFKDFDIILYQVHQEPEGGVNISIMPGDKFDISQRIYCEKIIRENLAGIPVNFSYDDEIIRNQQNKLCPVISDYQQ